MIDLKELILRKEDYQKAAKAKGIKINVNHIADLVIRKNELIRHREILFNQRKKNAAGYDETTTKKSAREKGIALKKKIEEISEQISIIDEKLKDLVVLLPIIPSPDTPLGQDARGNVVDQTWGEPPRFNFPVQDHLHLGNKLDILDLERGVKIGGYRSYFLKNEGALLQMALMMYALKKMVEKGFTPFIPPTIVKNFVLYGSGYFRGRDYNPQVDEIYSLQNREKLADGTLNKEQKFLIGTAEPSLLAYYSNEIIDYKQLPIKMCGFSQCYRSEIGSYGKDTKGIYRVHEFMKVEQVVLAETKIEEVDRWQKIMVDISRQMHQELGLACRTLKICTGDLGCGKYRQFDLEVWLPSRRGYGELGSASIFLDWQARRLNIRYRDKENKKRFVYMLNNTALASARMIIAILENFQNSDGSVSIPKVLWPYMCGIKVIKSK